MMTSNLLPAVRLLREQVFRGAKASSPPSLSPQQQLRLYPMALVQTEQSVQPRLQKLPLQMESRVLRVQVEVSSQESEPGTD
jgi:hypothetical protein